MEYLKAIDRIKPFRKIFVTGPQRSGTRVAAKIIAHDFSLRYVDEAVIEGRDRDLAMSWIANRNHFVLQCPGLAAWLLKFSYYNDILIIWMKRDIDDINKSMQRISWSHHIAFHKEMIWKKYQRPQIKNYIELEYESLSNHRLWVPKERRADFKWNQTARILAPE